MNENVIRRGTLAPEAPTGSRSEAGSDQGIGPRHPPVGGVWLPFEAGHPARQLATLLFIRGGLIAIAVTLAAGILGALYSIPALAPSFQSVGIDLRQLRPIHTAFASAWIFLGGVAVVHRWLQDYGGVPTAGDRWRLRIQVGTWAIAGCTKPSASSAAPASLAPTLKCKFKREEADSS